MNHLFSFDVCVSRHDAVKEGNLCESHMMVTILADGDSQKDYQDAELTALHMSGMVPGMPTRARVRI